MTLSNQRGAYADCYILFEKAMASPRGVQKPCSNHNEAYLLRHRLNKARKLDRENNKRIYATQTDHPLYDNSEFYTITISIDYDEAREIWLLKLLKKQVMDLEVEDIPGEEGKVATLPWEESPPEEERKEEEDEFDLREEVLDPSPGGKGGSRRF